MKTMLNRILRGLMRRSDVVGRVHAGTKLVDTVPGKTSTKTTSVTVPPGTYVVTGNVEWRIDARAFTVACVRAPGVVFAIDRGSMTAGGGHSLAAVESFREETELFIEAYHDHAEAVGVWSKLQAVRIK